MMSAMATLFFLVAQYNSNLNWVGLAWTIGLAVCCFPVPFGFCVGCFFFGLAVKFGILHPSVYQVFTSILGETQYAWAINNTHVDLDPPVKKSTPLIDITVPTKVDLKYKDKIDDYRMYDSDWIKHVKITHALDIIRAAGLACAW